MVLGMHRSGTSLLARMVAERGYTFPADTMPAHPTDNPEGYHESRWLVEINNSFLQAIGSHWKDPGALPRGAFHGANARDAQSQITDFIAAQQERFLALKDPRLCRLLPLWLPVLRTTAKHVFVTRVVRHPDEVFASLLRRASDAALKAAAIRSPHHSDLIWWRYNLDAIVHSQGLPSLVFTYEQLIGSPENVRRELKALPKPSLPPHAPPPSSMTARVRSANRSAGVKSKRSDAWEAFVLHFYKAFAQGMTLEEQDAAVRAADLRVPNGTWPHALSAEDIEILAIGAAKELSATFPVPLPPQENILSRLFTPKPIKLLFVSHDPLSRAHIYRVKNPIDSLHRIGVQADWIPAVEAKMLSVLQRYSSVLLVRCAWDDHVARIISYCHRQRIPIGYDIDDYIFNSDVIGKGYIAFIDNLPLPDREEWRHRIQSIRRTAEAADYITTPTDVLAELARNELAKPVTTIPNCFSPENLALAGYWHARAVNEDGLIRIGYASGTPTHDADFGEIRPVVQRLLSEDPRLRLRIVGTLEPALNSPSAIAQVEHRSLVRHINLAQELSEFHINLAPLQSNPFCDAKSPLKYFEAALVGVPTIAAANPTYRQAIDDGIDGLLAVNSEQWEDKLRMLIDDTRQRRSLASAAFLSARYQFFIDNHVHKYKAFGDSNH